MDKVAKEKEQKTLENFKDKANSKVKDVKDANSKDLASRI